MLQSGSKFKLSMAEWNQYILARWSY